MSVKIRLKKFGTKKRPYYRVVVLDSRQPREGRTLDELGFYHPIEAEDKQVQLNTEKVKQWLSKGAEPTDTVRSLFKRCNITMTR